jgi:hypothetical protein
MTFAAFMQTMDRLSGLKFRPASLQTHWEALSDLGAAELNAAIERAQRECDEFPSPKMLRAFVALSAPRIGPDEDRSRPIAQPIVIEFPQAGLKLPVNRDWTFYCNTCEDTGWASFQCSGNASCGRDTEHYAHEYVKHCACWDSNPAVLKKRQRSAQQAATRGTNREN